MIFQKDDIIKRRGRYYIAIVVDAEYATFATFHHNEGYTTEFKNMFVLSNRDEFRDFLEGAWEFCPNLIDFLNPLEEVDR